MKKRQSVSRSVRALRGLRAMRSFEVIECDAKSKL